VKQPDRNEFAVEPIRKIPLAAASERVERLGVIVGVSQMYLDAFPDLTFEIRNRYGCGENVSVLEFTAQGTHQGELQGIPPAGRAANVLVSDIIELRDGKTVSEREYFDSMSMLQQLGVVPQSVSRIIGGFPGRFRRPAIGGSAVPTPPTGG
jgi:Predicted ester cyclase